MKWLLLAKPWLLPAGLLLAGVAVGGSWWHGYQTGKRITQADQLQAIEDLRERATVLADELEQEKTRERVVYRDRVRTVLSTPDSSGCADVRIPLRVFDEIRSATGQPTDGTVRAPDAGRGDES